MKLWVLPLTTLLGSCGSLDGELRDAEDGRLVDGAIVSVSTTGWGRRDGQLVWDAETIHRTRTDGRGHFRFPGIDGGGRLQVESKAGTFDHGTLCPGSPMKVWVGGPNRNARTDRPLVIGDDRDLASFDNWRAMSTEQLGVRITGGNPDNTLGIVRIESESGVAFVEGTGSIPKWPPPASFRKAVTMNLSRQCGWFFVYTPVGQVVIDAQHPGGTQNVGGPAYGVTLFTILKPDVGARMGPSPDGPTRT